MRPTTVYRTLMFSWKPLVLQSCPLCQSPRLPSSVRASSTAKEAALPATSQVDGSVDSHTKGLSSRVKRKTALHVGYVGTGYRGLQAQGSDSDVTTIEGELMRAVHKAGGILTSNLGNAQRLGLSRSSRTDKGVHSLSTVVALKLECPGDNFHNDPEGVALAQDVNQHLPQHVRVFSIQRVNKSFNARALGKTRSYNYYLPACVLSSGQNGDLAAAMQRLRACLKLFHGNNPFHNYTQRRRYRAGNREQRSGWRQHGTAKPSPSHRISAYTDAGLSASSSAAHRSGPADDSDSDGDSSEEDDIEMADDLAGTSSRRHWSEFTEPRMADFRWTNEIDEDDRIVKSHYRVIEQASASDPAPLLPGAPDCVCICFVGESFMLHQIRHMVGAAVAAARSIVPLAFVRASLSAPARASFPLAPAEVLVLADCSFHPFPLGGGGVASSVVKLSGNALSLRAHGQAQQEAFRTQVLNPELHRLMSGDNWDWWQHELGRWVYPQQEAQQFIDSHAAWSQMQAEAEQRRMAAKAQAVAAADQPASA